MRSTKTKKPLVEYKTIIKIVTWFTGKRMRTVVTETKLRN